MDIKKITILAKYQYYTKGYSLDSVIKLLEYISINNYLINLIDNKQPLYGPIYSLKLLDLKILKTYIKNNLANDFIRPFKLLAGTLILFIYKNDDSL